MRSILPFLFLSACSDYDMVVQKGEEPAAVPSEETDGTEPEVDNAGDTAAETDTATVPVEDTEEPSEEDTGDEPVDPNECEGFLINEGYGHYEETETFAVFSLVGDSEVEVRQGETAKLQLAVTAYDCGDIVFTGLTVVQSVIDYTPASWVTDVEHSGVDSEMSHLSGSAQFEPIDGYNVMSDEADAQIFYTWTTDVWNANIQGVMDEVAIEAATTEIFEFSFTATEYIPVDTTFDLYLIDPEWVDVATGAEVRDFYYYLPSWDDNAVKVRVTIVE